MQTRIWVGAYIRIMATTAIVRIIRTIIRGIAGYGPLTLGIGAHLGPGVMIRIGMEDGAIPIGHGVLHVRRITIITAMDPVRHGIRLRPGLIDLTVRHLPEAPRVAALARRTTGTRLPEVECHVPAIWVVAVAIPLPQHHRHLRAPTDMLRHPQARVPRQDIAAEALADVMAIALRPPKAVAALTHLHAVRPHQAAAVGRIAAVAEADRIAVVVEADRMVVVATVEAEVEAVVVVDKAIGNSFHIL